MHQKKPMFSAKFQTFDEVADPAASSQPDWPACAAILKWDGLDGFVLPRADRHQNEYVPASEERLAWLTGFTGSAGFLIVLAGPGSAVHRRPLHAAGARADRSIALHDRQQRRDRARGLDRTADLTEPGTRHRLRPLAAYRRRRSSGSPKPATKVGWDTGCAVATIRSTKSGTSGPPPPLGEVDAA